MASRENSYTASVSGDGGGGSGGDAGEHGAAVSGGSHSRLAAYIAARAERVLSGDLAWIATNPDVRRRHAASLKRAGGDVPEDAAAAASEAAEEALLTKLIDADLRLHAELTELRNTLVAQRAVVGSVPPASPMVRPLLRSVYGRASVTCCASTR